ncbi:hypothetical protein D3C72_1844340 [compost metagenome]
MTLFGTTWVTNCSKEKDLVFFSRSSAVERSSIFIEVPLPGFSQFTSTKPTDSDTNDAVINHAMALAPTLPTIFISPILAIPTTKVENTKGAIIIWTSLIKIVPRSFIFFAKSAFPSGY